MTFEWGWVSASSLRDLPRVDELLHDGVIGGELLEDAADQPVDAGIADVVDDPRRLVGDDAERDPGHRRAAALVGHAGAPAHVLNGPVQRRVDVTGSDDRLSAVLREAGDDRRAREVARRVPAHAVGDGEEWCLGDEAVFVDLAPQARVGLRRPRERDLGAIGQRDAMPGVAVAYLRHL